MCGPAMAAAEGPAAEAQPLEERAGRLGGGAGVGAGKVDAAVAAEAAEEAGAATAIQARFRGHKARKAE